MWGRIISTHALTEGDELCDPMTAALGNFNSRPHGGRRNLSAHLFFFFIFQLTPSRRATVYVTHWPPCILYFNSRPHGGRLIWICLLNYSFVFQLTPSRRATVSPGIAVCKFLFQLTPSRRATEQINCNFFLHLISTHALTEGDYSPDMLVVSAGLFQLTPSRRATGWFVLASLLVNISTHALTEGDVSRKYFCNRSPRISTHALTEGDHWFDAAKAAHGISTHALTEGDNISFMTFSCECYFNSRPHGGRLAIDRGD